MTNRVILGQSGADQVLKVSQPGTNVLTTGIDGLIMDTDTPMLQVIASGSFTGIPSGATRQATLPAVGFTPFLYVYSPDRVVFVTISGNTATFSPSGAGTWNMYWAMFNIPRS